MSSPEQLDEERRLFYVAITRAKQFLTLSYARTRYFFGNLKTNDPSRFIEEINSDRFEVDTTARNTVFSFTDDEPKSKSVFVERKPTMVPADLYKNFNASNPNNIQTGMIVLHQKFGKGKVLNIEGSADNKLATIFFQEVENPSRKIMLKFAKLEIVL